jgi:hypothetical protein
LARPKKKLAKGIIEYIQRGQKNHFNKKHNLRLISKSNGIIK